MSRVKYLLTGGSLVKFRNGAYGIVESSASFGRFINIIIPADGVPLGVRPASCWDASSLESIGLDKGLDIICAWKVPSIEALNDLLLTPEVEVLEYKKDTAYWVKPVPKYEENFGENENSGIEFTNIGERAESEITVRTSLIVKINDKEVDLKNLSEDERKILKTFGVI